MRSVTTYASLFVFLLLGQLSMGQNQFGITSGVSLNKFVANYGGEENFEGFSNLIGYQVGVFYNLWISDKLTLRPELKYARRGTAMDIDSYNNEFNQFSEDSYDRYRFHYIELPIFISYQRNNWRIFGGPYVATCFRADNKYDIERTRTNPSTGLTNTMRLDGKDEYNTVLGEASEEEYDEGAFNALDFGLEAGIGYQFNSFGVSFSYNYGLGNLIKDDPLSQEDERDDYSLKNRAFRLNLYYTFNTKKKKDHKKAF